MRMLTLVLLGAQGASAAQVSPRVPELDRAQQQVDAGDFEDAVVTLNRGLTQPDLTDDQLVELYRLLGLSHLYLGHEDGAREAFEVSCRRAPTTRCRARRRPKVRALYGRIKEDIKKRRVRQVTLTFEPLGAVKPATPLVVEARIEELALGAKAKLFFRRSGAQAYSSADFTRSKTAQQTFTATVPAYEVPDAGRELEYYVEVADAAQRRLAGKGDAYNPLVARVAAREADAAGAGAREPERAWYQIPWVWVGVGVGVAAIATTAAVLATQKQGATVQVDVMVKLQ
ncbi:MAG: hypothetical protein IPJ65_23345 [Archangiaceae bacterium]|nr:hypothetical protein [Archangiaceae bacterium]